jgi:hypothetical protein
MPSSSRTTDSVTTARGELAFVRWELDRLAYARLGADVPSDRDRYRSLASKERQLIDHIRASEAPISGGAARDGADGPRCGR